jgi:alginate O-acetyltransferase complex protein AlgI
VSFLSFNFALFTGLGLLAFYFAPGRWRAGLLLALSCAFYLTWSAGYTALLLAVAYGVYRTARWIEDCRTEGGKRAWMGAGVMALVLLLFGFKSSEFIAKEFFARGGAASAKPVAFIIIPLGLSYYVFKMIGYLLDVYWETIPAQRSFVAVALYGAFFPQIVSGPIQRAESFFDQLENIGHPDSAEFLVGLRRILFGLAKKIVIADSLAGLVANIFSNPSACSSLELMVGAYGFAIQLYADLSGLTDIAVGVGLLFGVRGPENFDLPFLSPSVPLFWRRWHMSLTSWLADYLFTPLRMSLRSLGTAGLCLAILLNMAAIGLWHGIGFKFLIFGLMHGIFVTISVLTIKRRDLFFKNRPRLAQLRRFAAPLLTFHLVVFSLIFFRADNLADALQYFAHLIPSLRPGAVPVLRCDLAALGLSASGLAFCFVAFLASEVVTWAARQPGWNSRFFALPAICRYALYYGLAGVVLFLFKGSVNFIYARF